ncbi:MAG: hypothetical protein HW421_3162 [Ignavibacteria bacterium]|nr:hypothetical protein [Ignavibacteria bacterium]
MKYLLSIFTFIIIISTSQAQPRIAILPFQNMEGKINLNIYSIGLQDSLYKVFKSLDPEEKLYRLIPIDSIEALLAEMNLDPINPQYMTDLWRAVKMLNAQKVISGGFNVKAGNIQINAYIYDVRTRMANPEFQARNVFKPMDAVYEVIPELVQALHPAFKK